MLILLIIVKKILKHNFFKTYTYPGNAFLKALEHHAPGSKGPHGKNKGGQAKSAAADVGGNPEIGSLTSAFVEGGIFCSLSAGGRGDSLSVFSATFRTVYLRIFQKIYPHQHFHRRLAVSKSLRRSKSFRAYTVRILKR